MTARWSELPAAAVKTYLLKLEMRLGFKRASQ